MDNSIVNLENLKNEIKVLKDTIAELEKRVTSEEDLLKLAIMEKVPFTVWACNRDFKIVLWSGACERIYNISAEDALGSDYVTLFVDQFEAEQSRKDCIKTIDNDQRFENFLAYDHDEHGSQRTMLTNCFRVLNESTNEYLQAEVALEISDLELRIDEHRTLREVGIARLEQQKKIVDIKKKGLFERFSMFCLNRQNDIRREQDQLDDYQQGLMNQNVSTEEVLKLIKPKQDKITAKSEEIEKLRLEFSERIIKASKMEELDVIETEVEKMVKE